MDMIDHYPANNDWRRELHVRGLRRLLKDLKWRVAVGACFPVFGHFGSVSSGPITDESALNGETGNETASTTNPSLIKAELRAPRAQAPSCLCKPHRSQVSATAE
ncbi:hypothetical protein V3481_007666 [Fusarium oxysporum f. sp. vasinfectum]